MTWKTEPSANWMAMTWPVSDWVTSLMARHLRPNTIDRYCYHVEVFAGQHPDPWRVTVEDVEARLARCVAPSSAQAVKVSLRAFYAWAVHSGRTQHDPTTGVGKIRVPVRAGRPTPEEIIDLALLRADPDTRLMILLGAHAGLRRMEIAKLHTRDIDGPRLWVVGKGSKQRRVELTTTLQRELAERPTGWIFPNPEGDGPITADAAGRRIARALGPGWSAHTLRHRAGTIGYRRTHDLIAVQGQLGHASVATTQRYIAPDPGGQRAVAEACDQ